MKKRIKHISDKGAQAIVELTGSHGHVGKNKPWKSCCVITFHDKQTDLTVEDRSAILQIVPHLMRSPLPQAAVDGFKDPNNQDLSDQRSRAVCRALVEAGVLPERISVGAFGDPQFSRYGRVEVLSRQNLKRQKKKASLQNLSA
ncbi:MAG: OmpA family protein [Alphaproteobacteria bacterium]|nr:OmpA family protein [Alphaproteobacteria bacterium]